MPSCLSVEELVINDSFINYCLEKNEQDISYWQQYQKDFPDQRAAIEEAKQLVFFAGWFFKRHVSSSTRRILFTCKEI